MRDESELRRIAAEQDGLVTRAQVLGAGYTDEWIEAQLRARRWVRLFRKVFSCTTGTPTRRQRERAALLCTGPLAALSHTTAARRHGMWSHDDSVIHIVVPYTSSALDRPGVRVHRSRAFEHIVVDREDLPTVSRADTCLDLAAIAAGPREAMRARMHAALSMKVPAADLLRVMELRRPPRYRRPLHDAARLLANGVASYLESTFAVDVERAHGLPAGERQRAVAVAGSTRYEDVFWDLPRRQLVVRIDGWRWHSDRDVAVVDRARDNASELAGRSRLVFGWEEITGRPCAVARTLAAAMAMCGWNGTPSGCECLSVPEHGQALTRR